jgi:multicomponent Na+:H+ antiporter subunit E
MKILKHGSRKIFWIIYFLLYILWELAISSFKVAFDVITPSVTGKPAVIGVPLNSDTNLEITILASLISLTPGTLTLDISHDRKTLYVHSMFTKDIEKLKKSIKRNLERPILEILR